MNAQREPNSQGPHADAAASLRRRLRGLAQRRAAWQAATLLTVACGVAATAALIFAFADPFFDSSTGVRATLLGVITLVLCGALVASAFQLVRRFEATDIARWLDDRRAAHDSPLRPTLELLSVHHPGAASALLAARAARRALDRLTPDRVAFALAATRRVAIRATIITATVLAAMLISGAVAPRWLSAAMSRLADPTSTAPPWSSTLLTLTANHVAPPVGSDLELRARIDGEFASAPELWITSERSSAPSRIAMRPTADPREFTAVVRDIRAPLLVLARTARARSDPLTITPAARPSLVRAWASVTPPAYAGLAPTSHDLPLPQHRDDAASPISLPQGSRVTMFLQSTAAMHGAMVREATDAAVTDTTTPLNARVRADSVGGLEVAFDLIAPGPTSLIVTPSFASGGEASIVVPALFDVRADHPPDVEWIRAPAPYTTAPRDAVLNLRAAVRDDLGVLHAGVLVAHFDASAVFQGMRWVEVPLESGTSLSAAPVDLPLALAPLKLDVGDTIRVWAAAVDARPPTLGGLQVALTDAVIVRITSGDEHTPSGPMSPGTQPPLIAQATGATHAGAQDVDLGASGQSGSDTAHAQSAAPSPASTSTSSDAPPDHARATPQRQNASVDERPASASSSGGAGAHDDGMLGGAQNETLQPDPPPRALVPPTGLLERSVARNAPTAPAASPPLASTNAVAPADRQLAQRYFQLLERLRRTPAPDRDTAP